MTAPQTAIEVDFPQSLDRDNIDDLDSGLDAYRSGPGITRLGIVVAGPLPASSVQFVCRGDQLTQMDVRRLAELIVTDTLEAASYNPDTLRMRGD